MQPALTKEEAHNLLVFLNSALKHEPVGGLVQANVALRLATKLKQIEDADGSQDSNPTAE